MEKQFMYDESNEYSILRQGNLIKGKTLKEFMAIRNMQEYSLESSTAYNTGKGSLGQLVEEIVFGYGINSKKEADFTEVGMELKVVPLRSVKVNNKSLAKSKGLSVKERVILSLINYEEVVNETWETNTLAKKMLKILFMFYIYEKGIDQMDLMFELIDRWEPSKNDLEVIKRDWEVIVGKVKNGNAHELSEGDTLYLGAATKGANSSSVRTQPFSEILAKQRAFSLKRNFVEEIFEELLSQEENNMGKDISVFELVHILLSEYKGQNIKTIMTASRIEKSNAKNWLRLFCNQLIEAKLGEKIETARSLKKAGIEIKTVLLQENGVPKESMSFEQIKYNEIVDEEWESSGIREKFEIKKHLWIVFKATKKYNRQGDLKLDEIVLDDILVWNMRFSDLNNEYRELWEDTQNKIGKNEFENFIKSNQNKVGHIRPKAKNSNDKAVFRGKEVPKKAFWLNARFVANEIERLKKGK